ncbi:hypothetical protein [Yinghuangia soli]|uniref:Secreted protein n=1 Tax=Yinghuangia soli TaxID=2908204 RepID=A0AA41Q954_9ACTN|nr:hypothetical protein [Yinghuangia soli]MCF2532482.1 hypothetical protein [Yinghuangia soli]
MAAALAGAGALVAGTATTGTAAAAAPARWVVADLPADPGSLTGMAQLDHATTWVSGFRVLDEPPWSTPVLYVQDLRRGPGWTQMPTAPGVTGRVNAISATSPRDVWLVGDSPNHSPFVTTQHWDGRSWQVREAPLPAGSEYGGLLGLASRGPSDVWAVGWAASFVTIPDPDGGEPWPTLRQTGFVVHWDGRAWQQVPLPHVSDSWALDSISATPTGDDVFAVGRSDVDGRPIMLRFDGRAWSVVPAPAFSGALGAFDSVAARSAHDVWAVGQWKAGEGAPARPLAMHWDGRRWTEVPVPAETGELYGVALAPGGIVAVGIEGYMVDERLYGIRVVGGQVRSLDLPTGVGALSTGWRVGVDAGRVTVVGAYSADFAPPPLPLIVTGRL